MPPVSKTAKIAMPEVIDLAGGQPNLTLLHKTHQAIAEAAVASLALPTDLSGVLTSPLQYGDIYEDDPSDNTRLYRGEVAKLLSRHYGYTVLKDSIFPTAGVSSGLDMLCTLLPGDLVLVEDPTYFLMFSIFKDHGCEVWPVSSDVHGMDPLALEQCLDRAKLEKRVVKLVYCIPTFNNPTGLTMPSERRVSLVGISNTWCLPLVADEVYHLLALSTSKVLPPPLCSYGGEYVVSASSFSKTLGPGLRCGWIECKPSIMAKLRNGGCMASGGTLNLFSGCVVAKTIESGALEANLTELGRVYSAKLSVAVGALRRSLPGGCNFNVPGGGYFIWLQLPEGLDAARVLDQEGVGVKAKLGITCTAVSGHYRNCMRLCFASLDVAMVEEGCLRLGRAIQRWLDSECCN